jgi:hypothetical protein
MSAPEFFLICLAGLQTLLHLQATARERARLALRRCLHHIDHCNSPNAVRASDMTDNLTGVWDGSYVQPSGMVTFLATLIDAGGALGGSVTEPCVTPGCPISTHNASLAGHRSGSAVTFVKRYEPPGYGYDTVHYEGAVNADATEIDGRWSIRGTAFSGTFLMVRATGPSQAVTTEEKIREPVR